MNGEEKKFVDMCSTEEKQEGSERGWQRKKKNINAMLKIKKKSDRKNKKVKRFKSEKQRKRKKRKRKWETKNKVNKVGKIKL